MSAAGEQGPPGFAQRLLRWQSKHGRQGLPWQGSTDPYRVWLSEVMLQQTQVATVLTYYERFLQAFPTVHALAAAPQEQVLALWAGLGYYSRARQLHRCAQAVVAEHGGEFPRSAEKLAQLPGIGRSTAAAIAAFCFGERVAILDGNVKRVLTRLLAFGEDLSNARSERTLWAHAQALLPAREMPRYTQGLMDLGATLCLPREPRCAACPVATLCQAHATGREEAFPVKTRKLRRSQRHNAWLWLEHRGQLWMQQRPQQGVWAGLWSLPEFDDLPALHAAARAWPGSGEAWPPIRHVLTHFDWHLQPLHWRLPARVSAARLTGLQEQLGPGRWWPLVQAAQAGIPAPLQKLLRQRLEISAAA